jgi:hypothetical protein
LADSLEGVRSVGAVKWCQFTACNGCEGPQPSKPQPVIVATAGWALLAELEGVRSVGAVKMVSIYGRPRLRGTADVPMFIIGLQSLASKRTFSTGFIGAPALICFPRRSLQFMKSSFLVVCMVLVVAFLCVEALSGAEESKMINLSQSAFPAALITVSLDRPQRSSRQGQTKSEGRPQREDMRRRA